MGYVRKVNAHGQQMCCGHIMDHYCRKSVCLLSRSAQLSRTSDPCYHTCTFANYMVQSPLNFEKPIIPVSWKNQLAFGSPLTHWSQRGKNRCCRRLQALNGHGQVTVTFNLLSDPCAFQERRAFPSTHNGTR